MIYKIYLNTANDVASETVNNHKYKNNYFEIYCSKFVDIKTKDKEDYLEIIIKHKLFIHPIVHIFCDNQEINLKESEIVNLFNKTIININRNGKNAD